MELYLEFLKKVGKNCRAKKKHRLDEVDIIDKLAEATTATNIIVEKNAWVIISNNSLSYWESPKVVALFNPVEGKGVYDCLRRHNSMLQNASNDDDALILLTPGIDNIDESSNKQKQYLRLHCIYLRMAYKITVTRA